jgi:hypothetical protein
LSGDLCDLKRKYGRPRALSDPFYDNTPASLRELLSRGDSELRWRDFKTLLGPHLPAGTYEEVAYFLPLAFDCISNDKTVALDLCSSVVWFCSKYEEQLTADKVVDAARGQLRGLLRQWTSQFNVTHFDRNKSLPMCSVRTHGNCHGVARHVPSARALQRNTLALTIWGHESRQKESPLSQVQARRVLGPQPQIT